MKETKNGVYFYKDEKTFAEGEWYEWRSGKKRPPFWLKLTEHLLIGALGLIFICFNLFQFLRKPFSQNKPRL